MRSVFVQPEYNRGVRQSGSCYCKFHPVLNRNIFYDTTSKNIIFFNWLFDQGIARSIYKSDLAITGILKSFVLRAVFFSFLGHETYIGNGPHGGWIELSILPAEIDGSLIDACVTGVWNKG